MDDPAIDGVAPDELIPAAVKGDKKALHLFLFSQWLAQLLNEVAARTSWKYGVDAEELRDFLFERIRRKIRKITNTNNTPWPICFSAWCYKIGERRALNLIRHRNVEERYWDGVLHEHTIGIRGGKRQAELQSRARSQEEEIEQKEQRALLSKLRRTVWDSYRLLMPDDAKLISLWASGKKLREISAATGLPMSTVHHRLGVLQKGFVKEVENVVVKALGAAHLPEKRKELRAGIRGLIASSLKEMSRRKQPASPGV